MPMLPPAPRRPSCRPPSRAASPCPRACCGCCSPTRCAQAAGRPAGGAQRSGCRGSAQARHSSTQDFSAAMQPGCSLAAGRHGRHGSRSHHACSQPGAGGGAALCSQMSPAAPRTPHLLPITRRRQVPNQEQVAAVTEELRARSQLPAYIYKLLDALPQDTHPMTAFVSLIAALQVGPGQWRAAPRGPPPCPAPRPPAEAAAAAAAAAAAL
jgi:hypothetical protein